MALSVYSTGKGSSGARTALKAAGVTAVSRDGQVEELHHKHQKCRLHHLHLLLMLLHLCLSHWQHQQLLHQCRQHLQQQQHQQGLL